MGDTTDDGSVKTGNKGHTASDGSGKTGDVERQLIMGVSQQVILIRETQLMIGVRQQVMGRDNW